MEQYHIKIVKKLHYLKNDVDVKRSYCRSFHGYNLHPKVTVLCTLSPISFFRPIVVFLFYFFFYFKDDNTNTIYYIGCEYYKSYIFRDVSPYIKFLDRTKNWSLRVSLGS